jgi:formamidopyrimidine-DNA glycosylase
MPELPEVQNNTALITRTCQGRLIESVVINFDEIVMKECGSEKDIREALEKKTLASVERKVCVFVM